LGDGVLIGLDPEEIQLHKEAVRDIVSSHGGAPDLLTLLLEAQERTGWLSPAAMGEAARLLNISKTSVYSTATFYNRFRFTPPGRRRIDVCMGTACHVRRGAAILDLWKRRLEIGVGETTADRGFSLDRVDCVGCCAMAPVTVIDGEAQGKMTINSVDGVLLRFGIQIDKGSKETTGPDGRGEEIPENDKK
jgi:NADH-quinone oxidoreductase subunit E